MLNAVLNTVDGGAIAGAEIFQNVGAVLLRDTGVVAGNDRIVEADIAIGGAANLNYSRGPRFRRRGFYFVGPWQGYIISEHDGLQGRNLERSARGQSAAINERAVERV